MELIKKYLGEKVLDEHQIEDFLKANETEIKDFLGYLWEKQFVKPGTNIADCIGYLWEKRFIKSETDTPEINKPDETKSENNQKQINMPNIFDSGEHPNKETAQNDSLAFQVKNKQITFLNGKVNQEYCVDFDVEKLGISEIAEVSFDGLDKIGLQYFPSERKIKGKPTIAGEHKIMMHFKRKDWSEGKPQLIREVIFIINHDPRVLWSKNIPTPNDIEYYKPDSDKLFVQTRSWDTQRLTRKDMVAASQRGRSHAIEGKPRDDDFALHFDKYTGWYIMVVADGAGSAKFSRRGSQIACQTAADVCRTQLIASGESLEGHIKRYKKTDDRKCIYESLHKIVGKAAFESYRQICDEATIKQRAPKEYATTLLLSISKKFAFGWFIGVFWVGDGGIGIYRKEPQELKILGEPDGGEFAGQTRFLTMPEIFSDRVRTRFEIVEDFTALILMTDGFTDPKFETDANLIKIEKWNELWNDLNGNNEDNVSVDFSTDSELTAEKLLEWLDFWSRGNHDDRTIAILF
jgi:serine/threonine protein phosphatase PrpC